MGETRKLAGRSESIIEGNSREQRVNDDDAIGLLNSILKELKIMNIHLSMMTDNEITKAEID